MKTGACQRGFPDHRATQFTIAMLLVFESSSSSVVCPDRPRPGIQPSREGQFQGSFGVQGEKRYTEGRIFGVVKLNK